MTTVARAAGCEAVAVPAEGHQADRGGVPAQGEDLGPGRRVPQLDRPVTAGRGDAPPVRTVIHAQDASRVPSQGESLSAGRRIADLNGSFIRPGDRLSIGAERYAAKGTFHGSPRTLAGESNPACDRVPDGQLAEVGDRGEPTSVGAEGHAAEREHMPTENFRLTAGRRVPEPDG